MKVDGKHVRSIWLGSDGWTVAAVDQRRLPHEFVVAHLASCDAAADAIRTMLVRGAPLIGATAAYGMALAMREDASDAGLKRAYDTLVVARLARDFPREHEPCPIGSDRALDTALITAPEARDPELLKKLDAVAGRVLRS